MARAAEQVTAEPAADETAAQRARRSRIIEATLTLASRGGYDAVQMRAVAEMSEVALGTLYRYFPSKVHLLVSAMAAQLDDLRGSLERRTIPGDTRLARVAYVLERSTSSYQRNPNLTEAMVRATMAADAGVAAEVTALRASMDELIMKALSNGGEPQPDDEALAGILQDVWFARQIAWLGGRISTEAVWREIQQAIELILRG